MMDKANISSNYVPALRNTVVDEQTMTIFAWVVYSVLCQTVEVFGIVTNIINIICFIKQGLWDPVNISLMGLAISDLGCLLTMVWISITFTPAFSAADLSFDTIEVFYLVAAMPHATFTRISSWITGVITLERCLCIIAPLKVKSIVTPERVLVTIVVIFICLNCAAAPVYVVNNLGMKFSLPRNKSLVGLITTSDAQEVETIYFAINNFFLTFAAFIVIIISTTILVISLKRREKWREKSTSNSQSDVSFRNRKVSKMVVMISTLFVICFIPIGVVFLALAFEPELTVQGSLVNIGILAGGIGVFLETVNSSVNIFIYYHMSTKYRNVFLSTFCKDIAVTQSDY